MKQKSDKNRLYCGEKNNIRPRRKRKPRRNERKSKKKSTLIFATSFLFPLFVYLKFIVCSVLLEFFFLSHSLFFNSFVAAVPRLIVVVVNVKCILAKNLIALAAQKELSVWNGQCLGMFFVPCFRSLVCWFFAVAAAVDC